MDKASDTPAPVGTKSSSGGLALFIICALVASLIYAGANIIGQPNGVWLGRWSATEIPAINDKLTRAHGEALRQAGVSKAIAYHSIANGNRSRIEYRAHGEKVTLNEWGSGRSMGSAEGFLLVSSAGDVRWLESGKMDESDFSMQSYRLENVHSFVEFVLKSVRSNEAYRACMQDPRTTEC